MSKYILLFVVLILPMHSYGQFSDSDLIKMKGINVGVEKNNSVWLDYGFKNGAHIKVKHTLLADKLPMQSWRLSALYGVNFKYIQVIVTPFFTSDWYTSFYNFGSSLKAVRRLSKNDFLVVGAEYIPFYDKDLSFQQGWSISAQVKLHKHISFFGEYGRKPDYRIAFERLYAGFELKVHSLYVKPMLEVPMYDSGVKLDHSKLVISMFYNFTPKN